MAEYIGRVDAIKAVNEQNAFTMTRAALLDVLNSIPAAEVAPVVHCKDCKYNRGSKKCLNPDSFFAVPQDDDFCSYGERRDGGERNG